MKRKRENPRSGVLRLFAWVVLLLSLPGLAYLGANHHYQSQQRQVLAQLQENWQAARAEFPQLASWERYSREVLEPTVGNAEVDRLIRAIGEHREEINSSGLWNADRAFGPESARSFVENTHFLGDGLLAIDPGKRYYFGIEYADEALIFDDEDFPFGSNEQVFERYKHLLVVLALRGEALSELGQTEQAVKELRAGVRLFRVEDALTRNDGITKNLMLGAFWRELSDLFKGRPASEGLLSFALSFDAAPEGFRVLRQHRLVRDLTHFSSLFAAEGMDLQVLTRFDARDYARDWWGFGYRFHPIGEMLEVLPQPNPDAHWYVNFLSWMTDAQRDDAPLIGSTKYPFGDEPAVSMDPDRLHPPFFGSPITCLFSSRLDRAQARLSFALRALTWHESVSRERLAAIRADLAAIYDETRLIGNILYVCGFDIDEMLDNPTLKAERLSSGFLQEFHFKSITD